MYLHAEVHIPSPLALSMDNERGKRMFKFDRSLMERLADNGFPMSQINVQRRMRPTISHHIRYEPLFVKKIPSSIFFLKDDPIPEAGGQRNCGALSRCQGYEQECGVLYP